MKPALALIAVTLTFGTDVTVRAANYAVTKLFTALRDKAANNGWKYWLILWPCDRDPYTGEPERLHYHGTLLALPGWTVANWIHDYWESNNGYAFNTTIYNLAGWEEEYIPNQAVGSPRQQSNTRTESRDTALASVASAAAPNTNYILDGSVYEKDCNSVNTPFVFGISSTNSETLFSAVEYPVPVYDADTCRPYDHDNDDNSVAGISVQAGDNPHQVLNGDDPSRFVTVPAQAARACESRHRDADGDNGQLVDRPVAGITAQARASLVHFDDDNAAPVAPACESCNSVGGRGETGRGGLPRVHVSPRQSPNPGCHAAICDIAPVKAPTSTRPPRAAPATVTPAA